MAEIPLWILKDLRCKNCNLFLSHGPVYLIKDGASICARCKILAKHNYRNWIYEELAGYFRFPCAFWENHCNETSPWNFGHEHELHCPYNGGCKLMCVNPVAYFKSKRKLPSDGCLFYMEISENRTDYLKCKNCKLILSSEPIHTNIVGENVCHRCFIANGPPPNTMRNFPYEKMANIMHFPCVFAKNGCNVKSKFGRDAWTHEMSCSFKNATGNFKENLSRSIVNLTPKSSFRTAMENNVMSNLLRVDSVNDRGVKLAEKYKNFQNISYNKQIEHRYTIGGESLQSEYEPPKNKERGVVATHSGHVYATLTPNNSPFLPPQFNRPQNTSKLTQELQNKFQRITMDEISDFRFGNAAADSNKKNYIENEHFDEKFAPLVKEYAQHNPQNIQRSESLSIGNKDIIAEIKLRQEKRIQGRQKKEFS